jgi:hypothetical protein
LKIIIYVGHREGLNKATSKTEGRKTRRCKIQKGEERRQKPKIK